MVIIQQILIRPQSMFIHIAKYESDFCSHQNKILMFHDKIISSTMMLILCMQTSQNVRIQKLEK